MENIRESLYDLIGLQTDASPAEIERACLSLGDFYRPDRNPGDAHSAAKFAAIERAYVVLCNPVTRKAHDRYLALTVESATLSSQSDQSKSSKLVKFVASAIASPARVLKSTVSG
jgi:curved DNA-binding protein CbpA